MKLLLTVLFAFVVLYLAHLNIRHTLKYKALNDSYELLDSMMVERSKLYSEVGSRYKKDQKKIKHLEQQMYILISKKKRILFKYWNNAKVCKVLPKIK